jgi:arylsulfatase A-like enzyme
MRQPNIVLVLTDHFRPDWLGVHTPHLVRLAAGGVRFDGAHCAAPLCQPSRVSLVTGLLPSQHGVCGNQSAPVAQALRDESYPRLLQGAGYHTALVGKHHFVDRYGLGVDVCRDDDEVRGYGFDTLVQVVDDGENQHNDDAYTRWLRDRGRLEEFRAAYAAGVAEGRHPFSAGETADGFIAEQALRFLREYRDDKPFYLNVGFVGPHPPYWHPGEPAAASSQMPPPRAAPDTAEVRERRAHYTEKCRLIDGHVGRILDALRERGSAEDTVFVFTSDHGDCLGDYGIWDKRHFYWPSVGVPLVMAGPGVPAGERMNGPRVSRALVSLLDLYPTLLALAGTQPDARRRRFGRDLLAMLGGARESMHDAVFAELATSAMVNDGMWKLVFDPEQGGTTHLFNLRSDPGELENLAGRAGYEAVEAALIRRILTERIRLSQSTHVKEEQRLQRVRRG